MGGGLFGSAQTVPTQQNTSQVVNQTGNQASTATQSTVANPYALNLANMFGNYISPTGSLALSQGKGQELFQPYYGGWEEAAGTQQMNFMNALSPYQGKVPEWLNQGAGLMNEGADIIKTAPNLVNQGAGFMTRSGEAAAAPITGEDVSGFYNPMAGNVTAQLQNIFGQQNLANRLGSTAKMGGVGGDRAAVGMGILANQQGLAAGQTYADLYQRALQAAQQQKAQQVSGMLGAGQGLVGAGGVTGAIGQGVAGVGGQLGQQGLNFGQLQLATNQAAADAARYQAFHPLIQMQMLSQALPGFIGLGQTGAATQATQSNLAGTQTGTGLSQTTYPAPPILPQIAGLGLAGAGLLGKGSDRRAKTDIQKYGKSRDPETGLPLYAFRYKGDPKSYPKVVGPMAQDVKKKYPDAVVDLGKDEYQDGGYVDGVSDDYANSGDLDYGSDGSGDDSEDRAAADRAAKQRWARAQQALKLLSTTKVFQPNYQKYQSPGIKMPPPPWQLGKFQAGGGVPGMGMARVGSPNRGIYPQALNPTSLLAAARGPYPQVAMPMRGYPRVQEGGRVDADTAHRWGGWRPGMRRPSAAEWGPEEPELAQPLRGDFRFPESKRSPMRTYQSGPEERNPIRGGGGVDPHILRANRSPWVQDLRAEEPGVYQEGGAVMQSPPSPSVSGVQQPQQQPAAPGPMPAAPQNGQSQPPLPAMGGMPAGGPPTPPQGGMGNPAQLLTALSIGMMMGSKRYQKGGRVQRMASGGKVGPWGLPPLPMDNNMMLPMPRPRPLPGMEPLSSPMPHFAGPAGIYEDTPDAPEREAAPNAGRSGDFESSAFTPDDEEGGGGRPPAPTGGGGGFMGRDASMALMQAGLGMLAASGHRDSRGLPMSGLAAIGQGGMQGVQTYQRQQEAARKDMLAREGLALRRKAQSDLERHRRALEDLRVGEGKPITIQTKYGPMSVIKDPDSGAYKEVPVDRGLPPVPGGPGLVEPPPEGTESTPTSAAEPEKPRAAGFDVEKGTFKEDTAANAPIFPGQDPNALKTMDWWGNDAARNAEDAALVKAIANGRAKPLALARNNPRNAYIMGKVRAFDPSFDETSFARRQRTENEFAVGARYGNNIVAMNTLAQHMDKYKTLIVALDRGDVVGWNKVQNELARQGMPYFKDKQALLSEIDTVQKGISDEAAKVFAGSGASALEDRKTWMSQFDPSKPRAALDQSLAGLTDMVIKGRLGALASQYNQGTRSGRQPMDFLTPETRKIYQGMKGGEGGGAAPFESGKPAGGPVRVNSPEEARKLPSGTPIILPDGRTGTVP